MWIPPTARLLTARFGALNKRGAPQEAQREGVGLLLQVSSTPSRPRPPPLWGPLTAGGPQSTPVGPPRSPAQFRVLGGPQGPVGCLRLYTTQTEAIDTDSLSELQKALMPGGWWRQWGLLDLVFLCTTGLGCLYTSIYWFLLRPLRQQRKKGGGDPELSAPMVSVSLSALEALTRTRYGARRLSSVYAGNQAEASLPPISKLKVGAPAAAIATSPLLEVLVKELVQQTAVRDPQAAAAAAAAAADSSSDSNTPETPAPHTTTKKDDAAKSTEAPYEQEDTSCRYSLSQWSSLLRLVFRVLQVTPPQDRSVDYDDLAALVTSNKHVWQRRPLYREAQALLLYRLLQSEANCRAVLERELEAFAANKTEASAGQQQPKEESSAVVLTFLADPTAVYRHSGLLAQMGRLPARLWSAETGDLKYKALKLLERAASPAELTQMKDLGLSGAPPPSRRTPSLRAKEILQRGVSALGLVFFTAIGSAIWRMETVEWTLANAGKVRMAALRGLRGFCILEGVYWAERQIIETTQYSTQEAFMWKASAGMVLLNGVTLAFIMKTHKYSLLPFLLLRLRDAVDETYGF